MQVLHAYSRFLDVLTRVLRVILIVMLSAMVLIMFYQVIMRYVFSNAQPWCEELTLYLGVFSIFLGLGVATRQESHLQVDFLLRLYSPRVKCLMTALCSIVAIGVMECDIVQEVRKECDGIGPDIVIECSGSAAAIQSATQYIRAGGELVQVALPSREIPIDFTNVFYRGVNMYGVSGREMFHTWKVMFGLLDAGLDCSGCISHVLPMERFQEGFDLMESGKALKVLLRP